MPDAAAGAEEEPGDAWTDEEFLVALQEIVDAPAAQSSGNVLASSVSEVQGAPQAQSVRWEQRSPASVATGPVSDTYDDKTIWNYRQLKGLAEGRGHRFATGAVMPRVIRRLRKQDSEGWVPGTLENRRSIPPSPAARRQAARNLPIPDTYDDRTIWNYRQLKKLAEARGYRFNSGADQPLVIRQLRRQDSAGWVPGTLENLCSVSVAKAPTPQLPTRSSGVDSYDDKTIWNYMQLRALAQKRGHQFARGADRPLVIRRLRKQDREGWLPGSTQRR